MVLSDNQQKSISRFRNFVSFRGKVAIVLSLVVLVCYYSFVLSIGLFPEVLGYKLGPSSVSLGIIAGIFIIVLSFVLTGLYTFWANTYSDKEQEDVIEELVKNDVLDLLQKGEIGYKENE